MIKIIFKCILYFVLIIIILLVTISVLLYIPYVQKKTVEIVSHTLSQRMNMQVNVGQIRLSFPIDLSMHKTEIIQSGNDTLLACDKLEVGVALLPLFKGNIDVKKLNLQAVLFHYSDTVSQFDIRLKVRELSLKSDQIDLKNQKITVNSILLKGGQINLFLGESRPDTVKSEKTELKWVFDVTRIELQDIDYEMEIQPNTMLLNAHVQRANMEQGRIDLGNQQVDVHELRVEGGNCNFFRATSKDSVATVTDSTSNISKPWLVKATRVDLSQFSGTYGSLYHAPLRGFDPEYISVTSVSIGIDSLINQQSNIAFSLRQLALRERSGIAIENTTGYFLMDSTRLLLRQMNLNTSHSSCRIDGEMEKSVFEKNPLGKIVLAMKASVQLSDILPFVSVSPSISIALPTMPVGIETDIRGTLGSLSLNKLLLTMPTYFSLSARAKIDSLHHPSHMLGTGEWQLKMPNITFARNFLGKEFNTRFNIPRNLGCTGNTTFKQGYYSFLSTVIVPPGSLQLKGSFSQNIQSYQADVNIKNFPIKNFLPNDSLGFATMTLTANGRGFDFLSGKTAAKAEMNVERLEYRNYNYAPLFAQASIKGEKANVSVKSEAKEADFEIIVNGVLKPNNYQAHLTGEIKNINLKTLGFSPDTIAIASQLNLQGEMERKKNTFDISAFLEHLQLTTKDDKFSFRPLSLQTANTLTESNTTLSMGDLNLRFRTFSPIAYFANQMMTLQKKIVIQISESQIDLAMLSEEIPRFELEVNAGKENILYHYLQDLGFVYDHINLSTNALPHAEFKFNANVQKLVSRGFTLDTVSLNAQQDSSRLHYALIISNSKGNLPDLAYAQLNGYLENKTVTASLLQKKTDGSIGFQFGCDASISKEAIKMTFTPTHPILGYEKWNINVDNFFEFRFNKEMYANVKLGNEKKRLHLETIDLVDGSKGGLKIDMKGIDLAPLLTISPLAPPIGGILSSDLQLALPKNRIVAKGNIGIQQFSYDKSIVGDVSLEMNYASDSINTQMGSAALLLNNTEILTARARYSAANSDEVRAKVSLLSVPLEAVNAFVPNATVLLSGNLHGEIKVSGSIGKPLIDGELQFKAGKINIPMIGTSFTLGTSPILIKGNKASFDNYSVSGPNNRPLNMNGTISFANLDHIITDLSMKATDFEAINVPKNRKSLLYGKANMDIDATVKGELNALKIRGKLGLLNGTEVTYVMRESPLELKRENTNMVTFVSFNDTTQVYNNITNTQVSNFGMDVLVNIDIANAVKMAVNLSADGKNRINVQGGGNLTYSMNALGDSRFSGRYELTGGTVNYSPPIISTKNFNIQSGSYVSWNGDMADPTLNITAIESIKSSVADEGGSNRDVTFNVSINIRNTLENLSITFDISTPDDLALQNQLTALTPEQRATQAMNMLIYNTYSGPGASSKNNNLVGNPLNDFIQKELNQWARNNLKNIDVSFGIKSSQDKLSWGPDAHTDYSYKVSKSLFNNRVKVVIGGSYNMDNDPTQNLKENLIDDISLEYMLDKRDNMFVKVFRQTGYESILEGEITQTGVGFVVRKKLSRLRELFQLNSRKKSAEKKQQHEK